MSTILTGISGSTRRCWKDAYEEHNERIKALLPAVIHWIETSAPENIKTCWYWHCIALTGNSAPLRDGITRDWVLERLAEGYQLNEFTRLLNQAETFAFTERNFSEAYQHRSLKTRLYNVWLQIWDMPTLTLCSKACAPSALFNQYLSTRNTCSPKELCTLSLAAWFRGEQEDAAILAKLALQRYSNESSTYTERNADEARADIHLLIRACVLGEQFNEQWLNTSSVNEWDNSYIELLINTAEFKVDISLLFALHHFLPSSTMKAKVEQAVVRVGIIENIDLMRWPQFADFNHGYAVLYKQLLNAKSASLSAGQGEKKTGYYIDPQCSYKEWFYESLLLRLVAEGDFSWLPVSAQENRVDTSIYYHWLNNFADAIAGDLAQNISFSFSDCCALILQLEPIGRLEFQEQQNRIFFEGTWTDIALNLHLLVYRTLMNADELYCAIDNGYAKLHWIRKKIFSCPSRIIENVAVEKLIQLEKAAQAALVEVINERIERNIELADIALHYEQDRSTVVALTKLSWDYGLGYGYHKDMALNEALAAVDCLANIDQEYASEVLERLSPIVDNVCNFTDGDHTRYAVTNLAETCARIAVPTLVSIYDDYVERGDWHDADNALGHYLDNADLSTSFVQTLCRTLLNTDQIRAVRKRVEKSYPAIPLDKLWQVPISESDEQTVDEAEKDSLFDPASIHPQNSEQFFVANPSYHDVPKWYQYWKERGEETELVKNLLPIARLGLPEHHDISRLLDSLFDDTLRLKGQKQAYPILVQGHILKNGWMEWWESDEKTYARLDKLIQFYPDRIDDFIQQTTQQINSRTKDSDLIIPSRKLVYLLANAGRMAEAKALCLAMVTTLESETKNLPLKKPDWVWATDNNDEELLAIKLLIRRLFWPVSSVKHHAAEQLVKLLTDGLRASDIEKQLIAELSTRRLESDVVDILTIFWLASLKGYQINENISVVVRARSILSDILLESVLPYGYANRSQYRKSQTQPGDWSHDYGFEQIHGTELPKIFLSQMKRLEDDTGIPASSLFKEEWIELCKTQEKQWNSVTYFFGSGHRGHTGSFVSNNIRFGISAYLMTLNRLIEEYGVAAEYAEQYANCAMMAEPILYATSNDKPSWIEAWQYGPDVTEGNLRQYIGACLAAFNEDCDDSGLGALSLPVYVDENTWFDVSMVLASKTDKEHISFQIQSGDCGFNFGYLLQPFISIEREHPKWAVYHGCHPLFGDSIPVIYISRIARWDMEYCNRGLFSPLCAKKITVQSDKNRIIFVHEGQPLGRSDYWHAIPLSCHPKDIRSTIATFTAYEPSKLTAWLSEEDVAQSKVMLCDVTILKRKYSYEEFETTSIRFCIELNEFKV